MNQSTASRVLPSACIAFVLLSQGLACQGNGAEGSGDSAGGSTAGSGGLPAAGGAGSTSGTGGSSTSGSGGAGGTSSLESGVGTSGQGGVGREGGGPEAGESGLPRDGSMARDASMEATISSDGSSIGDPCDHALFCEHFDTFARASPPGAPWRLQTRSGSSVTVDTTHHLSGNQSLRCTVPTAPGTAYAFITGAPIFPVANNGFYGRMMIWLDGAPTTSVHWTIVEGLGLIAGQTYHSQYRIGGQLPVTTGSTFMGSQLIANYDTPDSYSGIGPGSDCWRHANRRVVPTERWGCVEWHYDGPTNSIEYWMDGVLAITVTSTGDGCINQNASYVWTAPTFDTLRIGWDASQADTAQRSIWIDDLVIDKQRIGCPATAGGI